MQQDLLFGLLLKVKRKRPKLKVIITSATMDVEDWVKVVERVSKSYVAEASVKDEEPAAKRQKRSKWDEVVQDVNQG